MSDRDQFATAALTGLLANASRNNSSTPESVGEVAKLAYLYAEAMEKEQKRPRGDDQPASPGEDRYGYPPPPADREDLYGNPPKPPGY